MHLLTSLQSSRNTKVHKAVVGLELGRHRPLAGRELGCSPFIQTLFINLDKRILSRGIRRNVRQHGACVLNMPGQFSPLARPHTLSPGLAYHDERNRSRRPPSSGCCDASQTSGCHPAVPESCGGSGCLQAHCTGCRLSPGP